MPFLLRKNGKTSYAPPPRPHSLTLSPQFLGAYGSCEIAVLVKKKKKLKKIVDNAKIKYQFKTILRHEIIVDCVK